MGDPKDLYLKKTSAILKMYNGTTMTPLGKCTLKCAKGEMSRDADFFIINEDVRPLLGAETCQELNLIKVMASDISESETVNAVNDKVQTAHIVLTRDQILKDRAFLPNKPSTEELKSEVLLVKQEEYLIKSIEEINMVEFLPITSERLVDLRRKTELDEGLQQLKHIIKIGWPETKEEVPSEIRRYFDFKEELSIQDGILFKGNRVIVPVALRPHMITQVHSSHLGIERCLNKARDVLF
ncbi:unnamed protein product [Porites evermanni]|uniref:Uncharacterized protein n=1 Tax=Porites evermanni TaxID=104178 RepID=A0ABN8LM23_9CNID|nr:unnamed protein product [Porites evermanni]